MNTENSSSDSLLAALSKVRIPAANHELIRQLTTALGIHEFRAVTEPDKPYVRAMRGNGYPDLHIFHGYTNGFVSEDEIVDAAGSEAERAPSSRKGTWYVAHPINQIRPAGERRNDVRREAGYCSCGMQLSLTGVCGNCD